MGLPKITSNDVYGDDGKSLLNWVASETVIDGLFKAIDKCKPVYVEEPNPYNKNGQPVKHADNRTGTVHLTYNGKKIVDATVVFSRICLQFVLENGDRVPYTCDSKEEFEWIRKNLGQSFLDHSPIQAVE